MLKVVPDTNVVIAPGSPPDAAIRRMLLTERIVASSALLLEWREVVTRPRILRRIPAGRGLGLVNILESRAEIVEPTVAVRDRRDAKDDKVLECALAAGADLIVSGDGDLLVLHPWRGIPILSPVAYLGT